MLEEDKLYLEYYVLHWGTDPLILVPKSRQIMISWINVIMILCESMFHMGQLWLIQSKKEPDADKMVKRMFGVWERLPAWMRKRAPALNHFCKIEFPRQKSLVFGIPEGGDQVRSHTPSGIFSDESAFQPAFGESFAAAQPCIEGGGKYRAVSSAKAGVFFELCEDDEIPGTREVLLPSWSGKQGVVTWMTSMDYRVIQIHYSADPSKNEEWVPIASKRYRKGIEGADWQAEMEIDPGARAGTRVFPVFNRSTHVIMPFDWRRNGWPLFVGIDPGYASRCAVAFLTLDGDGTFYVVGEIYEKMKSPAKIAQLIKAQLGRQWPEFFAIGHDGVTKNQQGGTKSVADQFIEAGIQVTPVYPQKDQWIPLVSELIDLLPNDEPQLKIFPTCPNLISELEKLRYLELTEQQKMTRSEPEEPMKKYDHLIHAMRNVLLLVPSDYLERHGIADPLEDVKLETVTTRMRDKVFGNAGVSPGGGLFDD